MIIYRNTIKSLVRKSKKHYYKKYFEDRRSAEKLVHQQLQPLAKERNGEWFRVTTNVAVKILDETYFGDNFADAV